MTRPLGIGCMRLSTAADRDDDRSVAVLHAALDAGVRLLDTADAYGHGAHDVGHNERLIARALATWAGDRATVRVATKGGLVRPGGKWVPDGRAKHLRAACEASLVALGVERIDLYQLHAPDPRTPFATSVRALARLQREGLVRAVGLGNVSVAQIEAARGELAIASVQVLLGPFGDETLRSGVAQWCVRHGVELLAYRPLGGAKAQAKLGKHPVLARIAARHGVAPQEIVLAWVRSLAEIVVPLPGPTRPQTARSCAAIDRIVLSPEDLAEIDAAFPAADVLRRPIAQRRPPDDADGEVVLVMGRPGAGKTTLARALVEAGHVRLNRDELGGRLGDLVPRMVDGLAAGERRFVLDNTYATRRARNEVVETAWRGGVPVRCVVVDTPIERARIQAVQRMLELRGRLLDPDELARAPIGIVAPRAQLDFDRELEPPGMDEGFTAIERVVPPMHEDPRRGRVLVLDVDKVFGVPPVLDERRLAALRRHHANGWILAGFAWRPTADRTIFAASQAEIAAALGVPFDLRGCPHPGGPPVCWCRPPMPGLVVALLRDRDAAAHGSLLVGTTPHAERFAAACELGYADAASFFG